MRATTGTDVRVAEAYLIVLAKLGLMLYNSQNAELFDNSAIWAAFIISGLNAENEDEFY